MEMSIPIQRRKLSHEVADRLLARFRAGEFPPGSSLSSERQLMKQYGVGRSAVREALLSLSRMGLVSVQHGKRPVALAPAIASIVAQLAEIAHFLVAASPRMLDQLKEARRHFEKIVVRLASRRASAPGVEKLRRAAEVYAEAEPGERFRVDAEFHRQIAAMTGNMLFEEMSQVIFAIFKRYYLGESRAVRRRRAMREDHLRILERIAARDADGAAEAMAQHLERAFRRYSFSANRRRTERRKTPAE